jgi:hypothetical protein
VVLVRYVQLASHFVAGFRVRRGGLAEAASFAGVGTQLRGKFPFW